MIEDLKKALKKKTETPWTASGNYPFYATLRKPAPSLSKHDKPNDDLWYYPDVTFVLMCANGGVQALFDEIDRLNALLANKTVDSNE